MNTNNQEAFLALVRAGLWEKEVLISQFGKIDFPAISALAEAQGVIGLLAAGLEHADVKPSQIEVLNIVGSALQIEQRNKDMNAYVAEIVAKMREISIHAVLVKGQGIALCYEKPLWRPSGDVDFLLDEENYKKADEYLTPQSTYRKFGGRYSKEIGLGVDGWTVELHASLRTGLSAKVDSVVDKVFEETFKNNKVRAWKNGETEVLLPAPDEDVLFVFTHFIKHFYKEGMSLRQLCDWCRLLWTYKDSLNYGMLESWIRKSGLMQEWKGFAAVAVEYLGMPQEAMPFYDVRCKKDDVRSKALVEFILTGYSGNKMKDTYQIAKIFPCKALRYSPSIFMNVNWLKIRERLFSCI